MTDQQMEDLVERIIQRLRPPVLVMVTAAAGYRHAIRQRLAGCGESLHLALDSRIGDGEQWRAIGKTLAAPDWQQELPSAYIGAATAVSRLPAGGGSAEGFPAQSRCPPRARCPAERPAGAGAALSLRSASELNQLRGAQPDIAYAGHMQATLARLAECGIALCAMNEVLEKLASGREARRQSAAARRYLTVSDVVNNPALACAPEAQLTDAAIDF